jgi:hypothetical protein
MMDDDGMCPEALRLYVLKCPGVLASLLNQVLSSTPEMSRLHLIGFARRKGTATPTVQQCRAVIPLSTFMQVADAILSKRLNQHVDALFPAADHTFVGARPYTQPLDFAHGVQAVLEKGLDDHGRGAAAQADIEKYYDSLDVLSVVRRLEANGLSRGTAGAIVRHQMIVQVFLQVRGVQQCVGARGCGSLTGSRVAGALGRVPVEETLCRMGPHWKAMGFSLDGGRALSVATYVDNLFAVSTSLAQACRILDEFEAELATRWHLHIKPSSRSCIAAQGCAETTPNVERWPQTTEFRCLGHVVSHDGCSNPCFQNTQKLLWMSFFRNCVGNGTRGLSVRAKIKLLDRAVAPAMDFRSPRWPPTAWLGHRLDRIQRKMIASILRIPPSPGEECQEYVRRRARAVSQVVHSTHKWSIRHCSRVHKWHEHLRRPANEKSWPAKLLNFKGRDWLISRRMHVGSRTPFAGRTHTRALPGHVCTRWHDGAAYARDIVAAARGPPPA